MSHHVSKLLDKRSHQARTPLNRVWHRVYNDFREVVLVTVKWYILVVVMPCGWLPYMGQGVLDANNTDHDCERRADAKRPKRF